MELIDLINKELKENTLSNDEGYTLKWVKYGAEKLLEKEKEMIIDAYCAGYKQGEYADEILCDEYYNETYNNERIDYTNDRVY